MKQLFLLIFALFLTCSHVKAQDSVLNHGFGFGFQLNQYQKDFGFGLSATSPHFAHENIAVRLRANLMYNEHLKNNEITWTPYSNVTLGLVGVSGRVAEFIRLYGEGGILGIIPNSAFSSKTLVIGGYGLFGFEFFMDKGNNYFIEIGGVGSSAQADKMPGKPIYSNGLSISSGFRFYLK